jgi:hypothetical protein
LYDFSFCCGLCTKCKHTTVTIMHETCDVCCRVTRSNIDMDNVTVISQ